MISVIILLLILFSWGTAFAAGTGQKLEKTLPAAAAVIIGFLFPFGLAGILDIGTYVLAVLGCGLAAWVVFRAKKQGWVKAPARLVCTEGMLWFVISLGILTVGTAGKVFDQWDEFSHWGDVVRATVDLNGFSTNPASLSAFQSYPPGMVIFQYIPQRFSLLFGGGFSEWQAYFAFDTFLLCFMAPFFSRLPLKKPFFSIACLASILLLPPFFFTTTYFSLYIDVAVSCVFAFGLFAVLDREEEKRFRLVSVCSAVFLLPLLKDAGIYFAAVILALYLFTGRKSGAAPVWKEILAGVLAMAVPLVAWRVNIRISNASQVFPMKVDIAEIFRVLAGKGEEYRRVVVKGFPGALIDRGRTVGHTGSSLSFLTLIIGISLSGILTLRKLAEKRKEKTGTFQIGIPLMLLVYCGGLLIAYMFQFPEYEARRYAAFERYMALPLCGTALFILYVWITFLLRPDKRLAAGAMACAVLAFAPLSVEYHFLSRKAVADSLANRGYYRELADKIRRNTDGESTIYIISQQDNGKDFWVMHYLCRPNRTVIGQLKGLEGYAGGGYSIGKPYYEGDVWSSDISPEELMDQWTERYDYVAVLRSNETLAENYSGLFDGEIRDSTLYRIDREARIARPVE